MRVAVYSAKSYEINYLNEANEGGAHELSFLEARLNELTAPLAEGHTAVCCFVTDDVGPEVLRLLHEQGTRLVALRSAGFNNVDLEAAARYGITVARVPAYSPHAVAEHTVALMLSLNRKIHRAVSRVREHNFELDGLMGFDMHGRTAGVVGTGKIGATVARILNGLGCHLLGFDVHRNEECVGLGMEYVDIEELLRRSDIITLHCPLNPQTHHLINSEAVGKMKEGVMLINSSRGAVVETRALIEGLKSGRIAHVGLDVYEEEEALFFKNLSEQVIQDDVFARLLTFPNVIITSHQGFFTHEAMVEIARTTIRNISEFKSRGTTPNVVNLEHKAA